MTSNISTVNSVGHNIRRLRRLRSLKQQELADLIGVSRQAIGLIEKADKVEEEKLEKIAQALGFSVETLENFSEEQTVFQIENMNDNAQAIYQYIANPMDKILEVVEENRQLYKQLIESEKEKVQLLQKLLDKK